MSNLAAPTSLRFEHRTDPGPTLGIGTATPRLSWQIPTADAGYAQAAYEVEISDSGGGAGKVSDTATAQVFTVQSPDQILVPWPGDPLASRESA
jgi:alpha-L-rhamnosidase